MTTNRQLRYYTILRPLLSLSLATLAIFFSFIFPSPIQAQVISNITSDGSLPTPTEVNQVGNTFNIDGGTVVGTNQFQSLATFTVGTGDVASFNGPSGIANILSRVTGGQQSVVDGNIRTTIPGANLFLLNPFGVLFTENASLDIGNSVGQPGSFYASTADVVHLSDGVGQFFTTLGEPDVLTTASVAEFGFLTSNPADITVQGGNLAVSVDNTDPFAPEGKTLAFIGGDLSITNGSQLSAPSGRVELASVSVPGDVTVSNSDGHLQIDADGNQGLITLSNGTVLDATGEVGGTILIRAGQLVMDATEVISNTNGFVDGAATAISVEVNDNVELSNQSEISARANSFGRSGEVEIIASNLEMTGGSSVETDSNDFGPAGDIIITVSDSISLSGTNDLGLSTRIESEGGINSFANTGDIIVNSPTATLNLDDRAQIRTLNIGFGQTGDIMVDIQNMNIQGGATIETLGGDVEPSGNITLTASDTISISDQLDDGTRSGIRNTNEFGFGGTGSISIQTGNLLLSSRSRIESNTFFGLGLGEPKISISAEEAINVSGDSDIVVQADFTDVGPLDLSASTITLDQGSLRTIGVSDGNAGPININANNFFLQNGGQANSSTFGFGKGGDVTINVTDNLSLDGQFTDASGKITRSGIFSTSQSFGDAGQISVSTNDLNLSGGAQINSSTLGDGKGGDITVNANGPASFSGDNSGLFSNSEGTGTGGNIELQATDLQFTNGAVVTANSSGNGNSGNLTLTATGNFQSDNSTITTSAVQGQGGDVDITAGQNVQLTNNTTVSAESSGAGNSGGVNISADGNFQSTNSTVSTSAQQAQGGDIAITAGQNMQLNNNTTVAAESSGAGNSGAVTLTATGGNFQSTNSTVSTSAQQAEGGDIDITAGQNVQLTNNTTISAETFGLGDAGDITVTSGNNIQMVNSLITTQAAQASGGNIKLTAPTNIQLVNSQIISSVQGGEETEGGNIDLDPQFIILQNSQVLANAFLGSGGNITFTATQGIVIDPSSIVDASSTFGTSGNIIFNSQAVTSAIAETITPLPQKIVKIANLFAERCAAQKGGQFSSFTQSGPEGLPPAPGGFLPSPLNFSNPAASPSSALPSSGAAIAASSLTGLRLGLEPVVGSPHGQLDSGLPSINLFPEFGCAA